MHASQRVLNRWLLVDSEGCQFRCLFAAWIVDCRQPELPCLPLLQERNRTLVGTHRLSHAPCRPLHHFCRIQRAAESARSLEQVDHFLDLVEGGFAQVLDLVAAGERYYRLAIDSQHQHGIRNHLSQSSPGGHIVGDRVASDYASESQQVQSIPQEQPAEGYKHQASLFNRFAAGIIQPPDQRED